LPEHWFDANVFIEPNKRYYSFALAPGYWTFLEQKGTEGVILSSTMVYDELVGDKEDDLAEWAKSQKDSGLFVEPDQAVQANFELIAAYVQANYVLQAVSEFLAGADPWIIAHARTYGGSVVTFETRNANRRKVKIPNVCDAFNVEVEDLFVVLKALGLTLNGAP